MIVGNALGEAFGGTEGAIVGIVLGLTVGNALGETVGGAEGEVVVIGLGLIVI